MWPVSILGYGLDDPKTVVRISVGARDFCVKTPDRLWGPLSFLFKGTGVVSKEFVGWNMKLTTHLYLLPRLGKGGAVPLPPPIRLHSVDRDRFTVLKLLGCWPDDSGTRAPIRGRSKRFVFRFGLPKGLWGVSELF